MGKFDTLVTVADWTAVLDALLHKATVAAETGEEAKKVQSDLFAFIKASPGKCDFLDDIAFKAANDLFQKDVARLIESIASRKSELQIVTKVVKGVTEDLEKSESDLRFDKIIETLEVSAGLINQLKTTHDELGEEDQSLFEKAAAIGELVEELRKAITEFKVIGNTLKD